MKDTKPCPKCDGTGTVVDPVLVGRKMRALRERFGVSCRAVARELGFSPPYVSDLELGRRSFNERLIKRYTKAVYSLRDER